jgi:prefoldin subunit 5
MNDQQQHLTQLVEQRNALASDLEKLGTQSTRTREVLLKTQGAIEYLEAVGVKLPEPEVTEEAEAEEETAEEG